jgi:hypothetical protein
MGTLPQLHASEFLKHLYNTIFFTACQKTVLFASRNVEGGDNIQWQSSGIIKNSYDQIMEYLPDHRGILVNKVASEQVLQDAERLSFERP